MSDNEIQKLQKRVTNGSMGRREFLMAATALGLAATAPALYSRAGGVSLKRTGLQSPYSCNAQAAS
jgi:hypothetical protein